MGKLFGAIKQAVSEFIEDDCMSSGAAIAYYTIFSLPPLLVLIFFIASMLGFSQQKITKVAQNQVGVTTAMQQGGQADGAAEQNGGGEQQGGLGNIAGRVDTEFGFVSGLGPVSQIIGIAILIFSATGVFAQLQYSLNRAWEVEPDPESSGFMTFVMKRVLSLGMIVVIVFLLLVSLLLTAIMEELMTAVIGQSPGTVGKTIATIVNELMTLVIATLLFAAMFKILPDADMSWKDVWVGAALTAVLFVIGKAAIGWYLQNSQIGSNWGNAAASLVALLVWVYYSSLIVLFGAEMTQVWANRYGSGIRPAKGAVRKVEEKRLVRSEG